jgi:putative oxidoreductase
MMEANVTTKTKIQTAFQRLHALRTKGNWAAPLVARITLGVLFISTGWGKVHNLEKVTGFFMELGIPAPAFNATMVSFVELIGGTLLLLGLATEYAALPLMASMAVAIVTAKRDEIHSLPDLFGLVEWTYFALLFWIVFVGAGKISLDAWLRRKARGESQPEPSSNAHLHAAPSR